VPASTLTYATLVIMVIWRHSDCDHGKGRAPSSRRRDLLGPPSRLRRLIRPLVGFSLSPSGWVVKLSDHLRFGASSLRKCVPVLAPVNLVRPRCAAGAPG
jgi:hypothetical protein